MNHEPRILDALETGGIQRIVVIDDAFDPPVLGNDDAGPMLEFLEDPENGSTLRKARIEEAEIAGAVAALNASEYEDEILLTVVAKLYTKFVEKFADRFDPSGRFTALKGDNLRRVRPLLRLLAKAKGNSVTRIGSDAPAIDFGALRPDAIFVDYYLDPTLSPDIAADPEQETRARSESLLMLRQVLAGKPAAVPSVILMSSHSVRKEANAFREEINEGREKLFASRFRYISKDDLDEEADGSITVKGATATALLDIAQCHRFAGAVEEGLRQWRSGAIGAIDGLWKRITDLELKDYAYLSRFRLAEEGQPFSAYLEWFLGEVLVDSIARSVNWGHSSFRILDGSATGSNAGGKIEGAFDGPTDKIADLYFRARVDARTDRQGTDLRTGDLYMKSSVPDEIFATITPDCDLVLHRGKRKAKRLMVVCGTIQPVNSPDSSIADYIQVGRRKAANVVWNTKDIRSIEYPEIGGEGFELVGTLRPLYAQELQRRVLADLGRVGLAVAPALAMTATASLVLAGRDGKAIRMEIARKTAACVVIPRRGVSDKPRVLYTLSFASEVLDRILSLEENSLVDAADSHLGNLKAAKNQQVFLDKLCRDGQRDGELAFGIQTSLQPEQVKLPVPWGQLLVQHNPVELADEMEPGDQADVSEEDGAV